MTGNFIGQAAGPNMTGGAGVVPSFGQQVQMAPQNTMSGIRKLVGDRSWKYGVQMT